MLSLATLPEAQPVPCKLLQLSLRLACASSEAPPLELQGCFTHHLIHPDFTNVELDLSNQEEGIVRVEKFKAQKGLLSCMS